MQCKQRLLRLANNGSMTRTCRHHSLFGSRVLLFEAAVSCYSFWSFRQSKLHMLKIAVLTLLVQKFACLMMSRISQPNQPSSFRPVLDRALSFLQRPPFANLRSART